MQEAFLFDVDDLLLDYTYALGDFARVKYGKDVVGRNTDYNLCEWLKSTPEEVEEIIEHFNYNSFEFGEIKPVDGFVVGRMNVLRAKYPDAKFIVVTKCGDKGSGGIVRNLNLRNVFGTHMFDEVIIIDPYASKLPVYTKLNAMYDVITVLDDHLRNIDAANKVGLHALVLRRSHNTDKQKPKYNYVDDWYEMYEAIEAQVQIHRAKRV